MTNYQHFEHMTSGLPAPKAYLDVAWYFAVSSALERRVWFGDAQRSLRANQYVLLVGPPGVGKGLALREAHRLLSRYPMLDPQGKVCIDPSTHKERPLFYQMPDATSFEQLCHEVAAAKCTFKHSDGEETHCSSYFLLEELSSLFRLKKSEDIARLLLNLYDCQQFKYKILRTGGSAIIDKGCLNFIAGTTPGFISEAEATGMIGEGLASRFLIVNAFEQRFVRYGLPKMTDTQLKAQEHLQKWLFCLSKVVGEIKTTPEVDAWLQEWWEAEDKHLKDYEDEKLQNYFSRRQVQVTKMAIARHFSEGFGMTLEIPDFEFATKFVRGLESPVVDMARRTGRNSEYTIQERFVKWIARHPGQDMSAVIARLAPDLDMASIAETLKMLETANTIKVGPDGCYYPFDYQTPQVCLMPRKLAEGAMSTPAIHDVLTNKNTGAVEV